jgi:hypothetical protein
LSGVKRDERRGAVWLLIAGFAVQRGLGFGEIGQRGWTPCSAWSPSEGKVMTGGPGRLVAGGDLTGGPNVSARGERESGYPFGFFPGWAVGLIGSWAG